MKDWKVWLSGLIAATITGGANAISVMIVDPVAFNLQDEMGKVLTVALVSAIIGAAAYLKQSPLPGVDQ